MKPNVAMRGLFVSGLVLGPLLAGCGGGGGAVSGADRPGGGEASRGSGGPARSARGASEATGTAGASNGHARMIEELRQIAAKTNEENPYIGDRMLRELSRQVASIPAAASAEEQAVLLERLADEQMRMGDPQAAIDTLTRAMALIPRAQESRRIELANFLHYNLGLSYMRLGEVQNCVQHHTTETCILPIRKGGVHTRQEGSRKAIEHFGEVLRHTPPASVEHVSARWLYNIACMTIGRWPEEVPPAERIPPSVFESEEPFPRFTDVAPRLGLNAFNLAGGAIAEDFDNDGYIDIVTTSWDTAGPMHYFKNNGDGTFTDRTKDAGLEGITGGLYCVQADYDNDGNTDILVARGAWWGVAGRHPKSLLRNDGHGHFTDVTFDAGLGSAVYPSQAVAWADYDNDGWLDLFVGNEAMAKVNRYPSQLFHNNGNGTFTEVGARAGVENLRFAKGATWGDYDGDRYPDLYVSDLGGDERLYHNNRDGTFTDVAPRLGVTGPTDSFPTWFWDFDNDGTLDIFVSSYPQGIGAVRQGAGPNRLYTVVASYLHLPNDADMPKLYRGDGRGGFQDVSVQQNLHLVLMTMGCNFGDLDNDGYLDFYAGTGYPAYDGLIPNVLYHNRRGTGFADVTTNAGVGHLQKAHGVSWADFRNNGRIDIFEEMGGAYPGDGFWDVLFENPGFGNHWIEVKLVGTKSNRSAIGARIRADIIENGVPRSVWRWVNTGASFGANPLIQHIGLGKAVRVEKLEIYWPTTDLTQTFSNLPADRAYRIVEGERDDHPIERKSFEYAK